MGEKPTEADESEARKSGSIVASDYGDQQPDGSDDPPAPEPAKATTVKGSKSNSDD